MQPAEDQQDVQQKPRFHPAIIDDARKAASELVANYQERRSSKTKVLIFQTISEFENVVAGIPDIFAKEKVSLLRGFQSFKEYSIKELAPLETKIEEIQRKKESAATVLAERESEVLDRLSRLKEEINELKVKTEELKAAHESSSSEYERLANRKFGFLEFLKNLKPGRGRALTEEARIKTSQAFETHRKSKSKLKERESAQRDLESTLGSEKFRKREEIEPLERSLKDVQEQIEDKLKEIFKELGMWIRRLQADIETCANGGSLNVVDLLTVDVKSRVNGVKAMASQEVDNFSSKFEQLSAHRKSPKGLHPISADPGDRDQTSFEYFVDDQPRQDPTLFFTGQILETVNDSVSRRFVSCVLVEVFSPKRSRHVAFHLPPRWIKQLGITQGAHFLEYNPRFFYEKLKRFVEQEGCDFEDLDIKIVSGINVPPDQIQASLKAIGCDEKKMGLFQLPSANFSTLTLAEQKKILILGGTSKFLEPGQQAKRDVDVFSTVGGNNGYGHKFLELADESRYVV